MSPKADERSVRLSICITTFNRGAFIGATLDSILKQATPDCEVVIVDGGSTDCTQQLVLRYAQCFGNLRYIRRDTNNGFDHDLNYAVEASNGEYCWLMTDDDLLKSGAVEAVLRAIRPEVSLVMVNAEVRTLNLEKVLQERWIELHCDRVWNPSEMDQLAMEAAAILRYAGCFIIRKSIWLSREKEPYYGTLFAYLGVIFQSHLPNPAVMLAQPFIMYRMGNTHTFSTKIFETFMVNLPSLVWSLPTLSDETKIRVCHCSAEPWRDFRELLLFRGMGSYSLNHYRRLIRPRLRSLRDAVGPSLAALLPGVLVNTFFVLYFASTRRRYRGMWGSEMMLQNLRASPFYFRNIRLFPH